MVVAAVPEVSRFFGIVVTIYYKDHPPPHFHARYGGSRAQIDMSVLSVLAGRLPPRALGLVMEWAAQHQADLMEDWNLARHSAALKPIDPLE